MNYSDLSKDVREALGKFILRRALKDIHNLGCIVYDMWEGIEKGEYNDFEVRALSDYEFKRKRGINVDIKS